MKFCPKCKTLKTISEFGNNKNARDGLSYWCRLCSRASVSCWQKRNPIKNREKQRIFRLNNLEQERAADRKRDKLNPGKAAAKSAKRHASKLKATPLWLNEDQISQMQSFYEHAPKGFDVDHIVPLRGANICGLHVPWNLQYLEASKNRSKGNKIWPE